MAFETILKQPSEELRRSITFNGVSTVTALHSVDVAARGMVVAGEGLGVVPQIFANAVTLVISGGTDGERYLVTAIADDASGQRAETELEVVVVDAAWSMPDGGAPYLSITEFVKRFGLPEIVRATDPDGTGRLDRDMVISALVNAQAEADAHIAARYTVPLVEVPLIIKTIVGDLAIVALYPNGAPEGLAKKAQASTRMLERIQDGKMPIPVATTPAEATGGDQILIAPGRRAYPGGLLGY